MLGIMADMPLDLLFAAAGITLMAGFVKGAVGFAMPMIMISGLGSLFPPEIALAALILPTFIANLIQSLGDGLAVARDVVRRFWIFIVMMLIFLASSAQLVNLIPDQILFLIIGAPVVAFALFQLGGWRLRLDPVNRLRDELTLGGLAGFVGGLSAVWGPPLVAYLVAIDVEKREAIRAQGVIYGLGALALLIAHLESGVLNAATLPLSAAAIPPALAGLWLGSRLHNRMPQATFRRAMLVVLAVAGFNLVRRGLMG
ncbi:MAG TPA: hypothetical protein DIU07_19595 [Rhodobacteraceae bacterium]|nr:hypothetical protein [Paracoccaceae bacterium]